MEPIENHTANVESSKGYYIALCDKNGKLVTKLSMIDLLDYVQKRIKNSIPVDSNRRIGGM